MLQWFHISFFCGPSWNCFTERVVRNWPLPFVLMNLYFEEYKVFLENLNLTIGGKIMLHSVSISEYFFLQHHVLMNCEL